MVVVLDFSLPGMLHVRGKGGSNISFTLGVLHIVAYMGRPRPKGVPFSGFSYMKEPGFHLLKYMKGAGNLSFRSVKGPTGLRDILYECEKSRENVLVFDFDFSIFLRHCI